MNIATLSRSMNALCLFASSAGLWAPYVPGWLSSQPGNLTADECMRFPGSGGALTLGVIGPVMREPECLRDANL